MNLNSEHLNRLFIYKFFLFFQKKSYLCKIKFGHEKNFIKINNIQLQGYIDDIKIKVMADK